MDDIHRLLSKFDVLSKALDADLTSTEQRLARHVPEPSTPDEWRAELAVYEDALAIASARDRELERQVRDATARRDHSALEELEKRRLEIALEVPRLRKTVETIRQRLATPPTTTR